VNPTVQSPSREKLNRAPLQNTSSRPFYFRKPEEGFKVPHDYVLYMSPHGSSAQNPYYGELRKMRLILPPEPPNSEGGWPRRREEEEEKTCLPRQLYRPEN